MTTTHAPQQRAHWHDAYDAQMGLWRWYRTRQGQEWVYEQFRYDTQAVALKETKGMAKDLWAQEVERLIDCDPIYVSNEMCDIVDAARVGFGPEPLLETDLLTPRGFLYFARPMIIPDRFEVDTYLQAASWIRTWDAGEPGQRQEINRLLAEQPDVYSVAELEHVLLEDGRARSSGLALTLYAAPRPDISPGAPHARHSDFDTPVGIAPIHVTPWYFGMTFDGNEWDAIGVPTGAEWWWQLLGTTFRLMQQRLSHHTFARPDRGSRRTARKLKFPDDREVVIVRLRREQSPQPSVKGVKDVEWSHRWLVSGHWRNQPYPKEGITRQIWISPFVKGPKDKPLIVRPRRVFQWDR